ncbi:MAG TPA: STAS domain-containing protein [Miltoncostaeaceae bacterium]|nr:STAS domain-containing protein [Miltoncostaeaceae bacterium]
MSRAPEPPFDVRVTADDGRALVHVSGELDLATASRFQRELGAALAAGPVVLDLAALEFIDSSGVRALDAVLRDADRGGRTLVVRDGIHENVRQILAITGVLDELPLAREEAG